MKPVHRSNESIRFQTLHHDQDQRAVQGYQGQDCRPTQGWNGLTIAKQIGYGANDIRYRQSEITKSNVKEVCVSRCLFCGSLPFCLFFPFGVVFVYLCFILLLKPNLPHLSPRLISLLTHPDRTDQPDEDSAENATGKHGFRAEAPQHLPVRPEHGGLRQGLRWSGSSVDYGEDLLHGIFLGKLSRALQVPYALVSAETRTPR